MTQALVLYRREWLERVGFITGAPEWTPDSYDLFLGHVGGRDLATAAESSFYHPYHHAIHWRQQDSLQVLLHEAGHALDRRSRALRLSRVGKPAVLEEEANAWLAAEELAHSLGVPFDYYAADFAYWTYWLGEWCRTGGRPVSADGPLPWRHK